MIHIPREDPVTIAVLLLPVAGVAYLRAHRGAWVTARAVVVK
jgi:hypothetical protein